MNALASSPVLPWLLSYVFNALWQIPLVFAAAWIATRMLRRAHPRVEHRVWVGAMLLEVTLPACDLRLGTLLSWLSSFWQQGSAANGHVRVLLGPAEVHGNLLQLPYLLLTGIALAYACTMLYFAGRLAWGLVQTHALARGATRIMLTGEIALRWSEHCRRFRIAAPLPQIAASPQAIGPVTVGLRHGLLLLPPAFLESITLQDLDAVLAHELAHIQRHDFAKNLLYGFISLPVAWHPLLWRTGARVAESRELICDAIAANAVAGRKQYAQSLLRLASMLSARPRVAALHAIGILSFNPASRNPDSRHPDSRTFERRVMTLTHKPAPMSGARRIAIATACCVLTLATCTSALALRMDVSAPAQAASESHQPKKISVGPEVMTGNRISGDNPTYPQEARAKKIEGKVVLDVTIGEDGAIDKLNVLNSPDKLLSDSAIKAVRTWRYRPYLLNGEPVAVETTINVIFCTHNCPSFPGPTRRVG
jgi:TonB family protein